MYQLFSFLSQYFIKKTTAQFFHTFPESAIIAHYVFFSALNRFDFYSTKCTISTLIAYFEKLARLLQYSLCKKTEQQFFSTSFLGITSLLFNGDAFFCPFYKS
jgi:hypothetical protein